jgi:hypothetical protein
MASSKRVVFSFDERSYDNLQSLQRKGKFTTMADAVRDSLLITRGLQSQMEQGFTEVVVRNPGTGEERVAIVPSLTPLSKR